MGAKQLASPQEQRLTDAIEFAKDQLKQTGNLSVMFIGFRGPEAFVFVTPFSNDQEKHQILNILNVVFVTAGFDQYVVISEAWMSARALKEDVRPGQASDKREVLLVNSVTKTSKAATIIPFGRKGEQIVFEKESNFDGMEGTFVELLNPLPPNCPPQVKEFAAKFLEQFGQPVTFH